MRIACCIPKATDTHSEYVILIAFPQQQWLHELASVLRYTQIANLVSITDTKQQIVSKDDTTPLSLLVALYRRWR